MDISTATYQLRPYQLKTVNTIFTNINNPTRDLAVAPTGAGKTRIIAAIAALALALGHQILIITPRIRLLEQARKNLMKGHGVMSSVIGNDSGAEHKVIIGTYQTMIKHSLVPPTLIIIDECHLIPPNSSYSKLLERYPEAKVIGLTATPIRGSDYLTSLGWTEIVNISIIELIQQGYLVPPRSIATNEGSLDVEVDLEEVTMAIVPTLIKEIHLAKRKKILIFCVSILHAEMFAELLKLNGEAHVFVIHSNQSQTKQNFEMDSFADGLERCWLINVNLVSIGVDIPVIDTIAIIRDVTSFTLLVQMIGRGLRPAEGKNECLIYDFGHGTSRFGFIDNPTFGESSKYVGKGYGAAKTCLQCNTLNNLRALKCSHCGEKFPLRTNITSNSKNVQLLSAEILMLEVESVELDQTFDGVWRETYRFIEYQTEAVMFFKFKPISSIKVGSFVVVERVSDSVAYIQSVG